MDYKFISNKFTYRFLFHEKQSSLLTSSLQRNFKQLELGAKNEQKFIAYTIKRSFCFKPVNFIF